MSKLREVKFEQRRILEILSDFCVEITDELEQEIRSTEDFSKLEHIRRREVDKKIKYVR